MKGIRHRDIAVLGQSESRIELCIYSYTKLSFRVMKKISHKFHQGALTNNKFGGIFVGITLKVGTTFPSFNLMSIVVIDNGTELNKETVSMPKFSVK